MTTMQINGSETGTVRLFHLDLPPEAIERYTTQAGTGEYPLQYGLGAKRLRPAFVDVVAIRDLGDMSLSAYLAEAYQLAGADFRDMRPRIDALQGHVVVLPSQAFDHVTQDLTVASPLRWVGTFREEAASGRGPTPRSKAAHSRPAGDTADKAPSDRRMPPLAMTALGVLAVLVLGWLVLGLT